MIRFEEPEIKVVRFSTSDVVTTSGYAPNDTMAEWSYTTVVGGEDGDIPL